MKSGYLSSNQRRALDDILMRKTKHISGFSGSVTRSILTKRKQDVQSFFAANTFNVDELGLEPEEIDDLKDKKLISFKNRDENFILTLKAYILVEYELYNNPDFRPNVDRLLDDLNHRFFERSVKIFERPLEAKEKAIIIALLGLGAVSKDYPVKIDEQNRDSIKKAVDVACEFLTTIDGSYADACGKLWKNVVGEGPVLGLFRRLNTIQGRTENVYVQENRAHFLDLLRDGTLNEKILQFLLKKVFVEQLDFDQKKRLIEALNTIGKERFYVFDREAPYHFDRVMRSITDTIEELFF